MNVMVRIEGAIEELEGFIKTISTEVSSECYDIHKGSFFVMIYGYNYLTKKDIPKEEGMRITGIIAAAAEAYDRSLEGISHHIKLLYKANNFPVS